VVEQDNAPSVRVIEKCGFARVGEGIRTKRFGVSLLGAYLIDR
jgi:RimJ/RimL family protein N-acetyltransferase